MARPKKVATPSLPVPGQAKALRGEILPPLAANALAEPTKFKFTEKRIAALPAPHPSGKQRLFWDTETTGFGVLVSGVTNKKTYVAQRKDPNGKTIRRKIEYTHQIDLDKAREEAETAYHQIRQGVDPKAARRRSGNVTLQTAFDQYINGRAELREKSKKDYRNSVERHLGQWLNLPLRDITPDMVEARHREIKRSVDVGTKKNNARALKITGDATANGVMRALRAVWNFAAEDTPDLPANPVRRLTKRWFKVGRRKRLVKADDLPAFYKAVDALGSADGLKLNGEDGTDRLIKNRTASDYLKLLLFTGLRRTEAASLKWDHVDFAARLIRIPEEIAKTGEQLDLPMSDFVYDLLASRRKLGKEKSGYIFAASGKHGFIQEPKFPLGHICQATGIRISVHDLRRTFITVAQGSSISAMALKGLVNHSLGDDVTAGYVIMTAEDLKEPGQRVADRIKQLCAIEVPARPRRQSADA